MKGWKTQMVSVATAVLAGAAWAAPVATLYDQMAPALEQVRTLQSTNPVRAVDVLTNAENRFRQGATDLAPVLRDGVLESISGAKQAISRKSSADLEARIQLIRAILGKGLYDAYFKSLTAGQGAEANALLPKLLASTGLPAGLKTQIDPLAAANDIAGLQRLFERTYAQGITNALQRARAQSSAVRAYLEATRAYALYLVVQDSPRARGLSAQAFVNALGKLSGGNLNGFKADVQALTAQAQEFLKAAQNPATSRRTAPTTAAKNPPASGGVRLEAPAAPPAPKEIAARPANPAPARPQTAQVAQPAPKPAAPAVAQAAPRVAPPRPAAAQTPILEDRYGQDLNPQTRRQLLQTVNRLGFADIGEWVRAMNIDLRARLAEAAVHVQTGDQEEVKEYLELSHEAYKARFYPGVRVLDPALADRIDRVLSLMQTAPGLRTGDVVVALGEVQEIEQRLEGGRLGWFHDLQVGMLQALLGIPRAFFFILIGLLAFFPLYLVVLAFGGRNVYWRYLALAFFFLLLPAMLEGLSYVGSILAQYGNLPFLNALANLSIQQSLLAQLFWGLTVLLVIGFATAGLRGIAAQFGLIQNQRTLLRPGRRNLTQPQMAVAGAAAGAQAKPNPGLTSETIVEWDEEF